MLKIDDLVVKTKDFSLNALNFKVKKGNVHAIIGPTGCGKTLLLESIIGLRKINSGTIWLDGKNSEKIAIENREIGYVPQDLALFPHLSVKQNIDYSKKINPKRKFNQSLYEKLIEITEISHLLKRKIRYLSGGEKQRVALVRALVAEYQLLLLDEPFSALNETIKNELRYLLKSLQKELDLTVLVVTHDLNEAFFLGDSVSVMSKGRFLQSGSKQEIYFNPSSIEVANFLGITNIFEGKKLLEDETTIKLWCDVLKSEINIIKTKEKKYNKQFLKFGIRKSDIMILRDDLLPKKQTNLLRGNIELIIEKVAFADVLIKPKNSNANLIVEMPIYALQKLELKTGQEIRFTLKQEKIFCFEGVL